MNIPFSQLLLNNKGRHQKSYSGGGFKNAHLATTSAIKYDAHRVLDAGEDIALNNIGADGNNRLADPAEPAVVAQIKVQRSKAPSLKERYKGCPCCKDKTHRLQKCIKLLNMSFQDKWKFIKGVQGICHRCLRSHDASECPSNGVCHHCKQNDHHTILCSSAVGASNHSTAAISANRFYNQTVPHSEESACVR